MAGLLGGNSSKTQAQQTPAAAALQIQSSAYGQSINVIFGSCRVAPNLIWYNDFNATPQESSAGAGGKGGVGGGGGGKGGGGGQVTYTYSASYMMALCEGQVNGIGTIYVNKNQKSTAELGFSVFTGTYGQATWGYLTTNYALQGEPRQIPYSAPYTIQANGNQLFVDYGVSGSTAIVGLTQVLSIPITNGQYYVIGSSGTGQTLQILFYATDIGQPITVQVRDNLGNVTNRNFVIQDDNAGHGYVTINERGSLYGYTVLLVTNQSVIINYTKVGSAPAVNQYSVNSTGLYTFNAANSGFQVNISYSAANQAKANQALNYSGISYLAIANASLGNSPQLPNHNVEVYGLYSFGLAGRFDALPSDCVYRILTDAVFGAGFPAARIGSLTTYLQYTAANDLLISLALQNQDTAATILSTIMQATNSEFVFSENTLRIVPYGDAAVTGNGYTYTPPSTPLYDLTNDDFVPNGDEQPVQLVRKRPADVYNSITLEYLDRTNSYNPAMIEAKDEASINAYGLRKSDVVQAHLFAYSSAAGQSAYLQLARQSIMNTYQFTLDPRYIDLDPMDIVTITDVNLGLNKQWVRIKQIDEDDNYNLVVTAEEYLNGTGAAAAYSYATAQGTNVNYNSPPGNTNPPVIFEPTAQLSQDLEIWIALSGGLNWGGCDVYISNDDKTYKFATRVNGSERMGGLVATLPSVLTTATGQTIDANNVLTVDLSQSNGQLLAASQADALKLSTLCYCDGEFIAYSGATLLFNNTYNLSYLVRGAYGSAIKQHLPNSPFVRLDNGIVKIPYTTDRVGQTIYVKFLAFNIYGGGVQQLSQVPSYSYTIQGTPLKSVVADIQNLRINYIANQTQVTWDEIKDFRPIQYEVRKGAQPEGAQLIGRFAHPPFVALGNDTYWIAAYTNPVSGIEVYSNFQAVTITGATLTNNVVATWDEAATGFSGTLSGSLVNLGGILRTSGGGDILTVTDFLGLLDVLNYGGQVNGVYEIPASHQIRTGRVAPCQVMIDWQAIGQHVNQNILTLGDFLGMTDVLDYSATKNTLVWPEIAVSQDDGATWGAWQKYVAGVYVGNRFKARMQITTNDRLVFAQLTAFKFSVDVPDRSDHYTNLLVTTGGYTITFKPDSAATASPFLGGAAGSIVPHCQFTITNAQAGDTVIIDSLSLTAMTFRIQNGGVNVQRTVNVLAQGY